MSLHLVCSAGFEKLNIDDSAVVAMEIDVGCHLTVAVD